MNCIIYDFSIWLTASLSSFSCFFHWPSLFLFNVESPVLRIYKNSQDLKLILDLCVCLVVGRFQVLLNEASQLSLGVWDSIISPAVWVGRMALLFSLLIKKHQPTAGVCDSAMTKKLEGNFWIVLYLISFLRSSKLAIMGALSCWWYSP